MSYVFCQSLKYTINGVIAVFKHCYSVRYLSSIVEHVHMNWPSCEISTTLPHRSVNEHCLYWRLMTYVRTFSVYAVVCQQQVERLPQSAAVAWRRASGAASARAARHVEAHQNVAELGFRLGGGVRQLLGEARLTVHLDRVTLIGERGHGNLKWENRVDAWHRCSWFE